MAEYFKTCGYPGIRSTVKRTEILNMYDLARYNNLFEYRGGCSNFHFDLAERALMRHGHIGIAPHNGKLYALYDGAPGGVQNYEYVNSRYIGSNPYIDGGWSYDLEIDRDVVVIRNDVFLLGLLPLLTHTNYMQAVNDLTMYMANINSRTQNVFEAGNDGDALAAQKWIDDLEDGRLTAVVGHNILKRLAVTPYGNKTEALTDLIEFEQYHRASGQNAMGLDANFNMKREAINAGESAQNADNLMTLVNHMLACRKSDWEKVNDLFGDYLDNGRIEVDFTSVWKAKDAATAAAVVAAETNQNEETPGEEAAENAETD